ncbi:MAG: 1-phosphofructokinase family hexose kinase [Caulobacter sp.]|nr:1-phosphofructokinase family hexose kinase [Caulobacter sp.]
MQTIVTVTINPAIDVSTAVERIEPSVKLRCGPARRDAGGGGVNVARVVHRLGGAALAVLPVGGLTGRLLVQLLEAEGVPMIAVPIAGETREDFTAVERSTGREYRFVLEGPHLSWTEWQACLDAAVQPGDGPAIIVASGSLPPGAPADFHLRLAANARAAGDRAILDVSGPALAAALRQGVYLIKPNLRELQDLTGAALDDDPARLAAARALIADGGAQVVALTMGDQGALLVTADQAWRAPALPITPVSSVGAGDSFLGGMVHALAAGQGLEDAFRLGLACGSAALLSPGTGLCEPDTVRRLLPQVRIESV